MTQLDLFDRVTPECGACARLGEALQSGVRYCWGAMVWRWATDRVEDCSVRVLNR